MALAATALHIHLYEGPDAAPLSADERFATLSALLERGYTVARTSSARDESGTGRTASARPPSNHGTEAEGSAEDGGGRRRFAAVPDSQPRDGSRTVVFSRGAKGARDITGLTPSQIADLAESARTELDAATHGGWKPWFPVIDYDRCTNCMQCLSFCLFGVYGVDGDSRIQVQNQDNCKTNCPACSRVCPEAAIMFPKYKSGPINGDLVSEADLSREKMKVDISALLGGDVYEMLRLRSEKAKSRFSKERDSDKALSERQKCLVKLAQSGDIPAEVLMSLPSPEEIARRAEEAKAKAAAALAANGKA